MFIFLCLQYYRIQRSSHKHWLFPFQLVTQPGFTDVYIQYLSAAAYLRRQKRHQCTCTMLSPFLCLQYTDWPIVAISCCLNGTIILLLLHGGSVRQQHLWLLNPCVHFLICPVLQINVQLVRLISKCCYYSNMLKQKILHEQQKKHVIVGSAVVGKTQQLAAAVRWIYMA